MLSYSTLLSSVMFVANVNIMVLSSHQLALSHRENKNARGCGIAPIAENNIL
jgi:hypothetical protein